MAKSEQNLSCRLEVTGTRAHAKTRRQGNWEVLALILPHPKIRILDIFNAAIQGLSETYDKMAPLIEMPNQPRRPAKVYGRRRGLPEMRDVHRQLFGTDENDENEIEKGLAQLSLSSKPTAPPLDTGTLKGVPFASPIKICSPQQISLPPPKETPQRSFEQATPFFTKCSTLKRHRSRHNHSSTAVPLTSFERRQLQPLLSQPNVHSQVVHFPTFATRLLSKFDVTKSGEGSFSECLLLTHKTTSSDVAILKIIPFDLRDNASSETSQPADSSEASTITNSTVSAVLREVQILSALSPFHGFAQLRSCHVVRGPWHPGFLDAYHAFRTSFPDLAENPLPSERWGQDMIYGVIEMDNAGSDLEALVKPNAFQVFDAFWMSVVLMAVVEKEVEFEHRDLHMSNICYRERVSGRGYDIDRELVKGMKDDPDVLLGLTNLKITIIDYTMSRLRMRGDDGLSEWRVLFNPKSAWSGSSDDVTEAEDQNGTTEASLEENHQTLTGRRMRQLALNCVDSSTPSSTKPNKWSTHVPQTNIVWLAHLLYQLLDQAGARPRHIPGSSPYAKKLQSRIWKQLREVLALIDRDVDGEDALEVGSTVDLLSLGIEKGWLREVDVEGFKRELNEEG